MSLSLPTGGLSMAAGLSMIHFRATAKEKNYARVSGKPVPMVTL
jgi:hypothetical protein